MQHVRDILPEVIWQRRQNIPRSEAQNVISSAEDMAEMRGLSAEHERLKRKVAACKKCSQAAVPVCSGGGPTSCY